MNGSSPWLDRHAPKALVIPVYDIVENDRGELLLTLDQINEDAPDAVEVMVSSRMNEAAMRRRPGEFLGLTALHPEAAKRLRQLRNILVVEMANDVIGHSYRAAITVTRD